MEVENVMIVTILNNLKPEVINIEKYDYLSDYQWSFLRSIKTQFWSKGVLGQELASALSGLGYPDEKIPDQLREYLTEIPLNYEYNGDERVLICCRDPINDTSRIWVGINNSTILKIPFLEAFCSERWKINDELPILLNVSPFSLRLIDFVLMSGNDIQSIPLTNLPLQLFDLFLEIIIEDLDFLGIPYIIPDLEDLDLEDIHNKIRDSKGHQRKEAAQKLVVALNLGSLIHACLTKLEKNLVYESVLSVVSQPKVFGCNLSRNLEHVASNLPFSERQKLMIQIWVDTWGSFTYQPNKFDIETESIWKINLDF